MKNKNSRKELINFIKYYVFTILVFSGICISPVFSTIVAICCCIAVLFGPLKVIQAISLLVLVRFFNPAIALFSTNIGLFSWVVLLLTSIFYIPWGLFNITKLLIPFILFSIVALLTSLVVSNSISISVLKIVSFCLGTLMILSVFSKLKVSQIRLVIIWVFAIVSAITTLSLLTFLNRDIAYHLNGIGFQGVLNHPQTLGVFLAPFAAFFGGKFLFESKKIISLDALFFFVLVGLIMLTQARTAAVSVVLSIIFSSIVVLLPDIKAKIKDRRSFVIKSLLGSLLVITIVITYTPALRLVTDFVYKRESADIDSALASRSGGISHQIDNFMVSPMIGNGFGVYAGPVAAKSINYFMGFPISAAVEKGFLPTALLEEVGIVGAIFFLFILITIFKKAFRNNNIAWISLCFSTLFINIGELVIFSIGGMGIFYWLLFGLSMVSYKLQQ